MKADDWKHFTLIYYLYCLKDILTNEQFENFTLFVNACHLICQRSISSISSIFCRGFEQLYAKEYCTPNMHLHMHLKECMQDFGPVYSFWCFGFEIVSYQ